MQWPTRSCYGLRMGEPGEIASADQRETSLGDGDPGAPAGPEDELATELRDLAASPVPSPTASLTGLERLRLQVQGRSSRLNPRQRKLARFLLENQAQVSFSTANAVGSAVGTSGATVVRFAQLLGYRGFSELRESLRDASLPFPAFLEQLGNLGDLSLSSPADLVRLVLRYEQENLAETSRSLDASALYDAARAIANARTVTLVGSGVGRSIVHLLRGHLARLRASVQAPGETIDAVVALANVGPGDVVLGVSFWRFARSTSEWLQLAKRRGAETIAIVDSPLYPAADSDDHLLLVRALNPGHGPSTVAAAAVANMLVSAVILTDFARFFDAIEHVDHAYTESHVYLE